MNGLTDAFDVVLQLRGQSVERILQAQHRAGVLRHHFVRTHQERRIELMINSPSLSLLAALPPDRRTRARMMSRVHYHSRDLADASDPGTSAVADVTIRATLWLSTGDPAPLAGGALLGVDWQETQRDDVIVHGAPAALVDEVRDALLAFIHEQGSARYTLPPLGSPGRQVGSLAFRFLAGAGGESVLAVGMNMGNVVKGDKAGLLQAFTQQDWALALSADFVLGELHASLRGQLGGQLPPPQGPSPVLLSDEQVCALPGPFGVCLDRARQRTFLDQLTVALEPGAIVFRGALRVTTDAFYAPDLTSTFSVPVTLAPAAGQRLQAHVGQAQVQLGGALADLVNSLSGGALEASIREGLRTALQAEGPQGQLSALFSSEALGQLASLGSTASLSLVPSATSVEIRHEGVILHGQLAIAESSARPHASLSVHRPQDSLTRRILHAGSSWAPGGRLTQYRWDFGDGQSELHAGNQARFVTEHDYAPGSYELCLSVTDELGRTATICRRLETARLSLRHAPLRHAGRELPPWRACQTAAPIHVELSVLDEGTPVSDALVAVEGRAYRLEGRTDAQGVVTFDIDLTQDHARPDGQGNGYMIVRASKEGYLPAPFERLLFIDCSRLSETVRIGQRRLQELAGRLREVIELLGPLDPSPEPPGPLAGAGGAPDPLVEQARDIALAIDVLTRLVLLVERNATALPYPLLLGLDARGEAPLSAFQARFEESATSVARALEAVREEHRARAERGQGREP